MAERQPERSRRESAPSGKREDEEQLHQVDCSSEDPGLVLCVDAGGTSCRATLMSSDGRLASGLGGPCNV